MNFSLGKTYLSNDGQAFILTAYHAGEHYPWKGIDREGTVHWFSETGVSSLRNPFGDLIMPEVDQERSTATTADRLQALRKRVKADKNPLLAGLIDILIDHVSA